MTTKTETAARTFEVKYKAPTGRTRGMEITAADATAAADSFVETTGQDFSAIISIEPAPVTLARARKLAKPLGYTIRFNYDHGEIQAYPKGAGPNSPAAYFTDCAWAGFA